MSWTRVTFSITRKTNLQIVWGHIGDPLQGIVKEELQSDVERRLHRPGYGSLVERRRAALLVHALYLCEGYATKGMFALDSRALPSTAVVHSDASRN